MTPWVARGRCRGGRPPRKKGEDTMKKLNFINIPVAAGIAILLCACSDGDSSVTAPSEMCWNEQVTFAEALEVDIQAAEEYYNRTGCYGACMDSIVTVRKCVDGVEFK